MRSVTADAETRALRQAGHRAFDRLWVTGRMSRARAYRWLASRLGVPEPQAHFGQMVDKELIRTAIRVCEDELGPVAADDFPDDLDEVLP
ncbi:zinc-finger-containing protein [Brucella abortus]|uniref:zinc-finger-containing protein n=1 Tax=Brucella abortus TaxID=235 RepID=UPI00163D1540|nr:zinc-finger-containing protein [Brucella abortus]